MRVYYEIPAKFFRKLSKDAPSKHTHLTPCMFIAKKCCWAPNLSTFLLFNAIFDRSWHGFRSNSVNNDKTQAVLPSGNRRWAWESARTQFECTCTVTVVDMRLFRFFIGHSLTWTHDTPMNDLGCSGSSPSVAFWEAYFTFSWKNLILHLVRNATIATSRAPWLWFIGKSINWLFHTFSQSFRLEKNAIFLK